MPSPKDHFTKIDGLPVRNLTKPIILHIEEQDCRRGTKKAPAACAAAIAAVRTIDNVTEARVHIGRIFLKVGNKYWLRGKTTGALRTEIVSFDRGGNFEPGTYKIKPLSPSETPDGKRNGASPKQSRGRPGHHRAKPKVLHMVRRSAHSEYAIRDRA